MWNQALKVLSSMHQCDSFFTFSDTDNNAPWSTETSITNKSRGATLWEIPEILQEIFSYLDDSALRRSALPVCRDWYLMTHHLLPLREVIWDDTRPDKDVDKVLARLPGAFGLAWYSRPDRKGGVAMSEQWQRLVVAVQMIQEQQLKRQEQDHRQLGCDLLIQNLQRLELGGSIDLGLATATLLPFLPSLTILEMQTHDRCSVPLGSVFEACPRLERLYGSSLSSGCLELTWSWAPFGGVDNNNNNGVNDEESSQRHPLSLLLRSLVLENTSVELYGLESLLSITPDLQELKLIQLSSSRTNQLLHPPSSTPNITAFFLRLKDCLRRHRITLNSFHYSIFNVPLTATRLEEIREICPRADQWSFWTSADLPPFAAHTLAQVPNVVTTLELHSSRIGRCPMTNCKLHQYLCESPHLLHLKAPRTAFLVDHFDIYYLVDVAVDGTAAPQATSHTTPLASILGVGTGPGVGTRLGDTVTNLPSPIWKCRNLRTLHIAFRCGRAYPAFMRIFHLRMRILFGYLSRVCSELRDLRIDTSLMGSANYNVNDPKMYLAFEGGFCLLSRLRYLERLSVEAVCKRVFYSPWELTWMLESEDASSKNMRQMAIAGWEHQRRVGPALLQERRQRTMATPRFADDDDYDMRMQLVNLGRLQDVIDAIGELEGGGDEQGTTGEARRLQCWPHLQKITLYRPNRFGLVRREQAIEQLVHTTVLQTLLGKTFY
ncbi:hypothetical protein BGX29_007984 [Mortierella sp. GBA35]|nr:hypothetical protein BGX29_007984 [Mortierella sp. GBA35]